LVYQSGGLTAVVDVALAVELDPVFGVNAPRRLASVEPTLYHHYGMRPERDRMDQTRCEGRA